MGLFSKLKSRAFVSRYRGKSDEELYAMYAQKGDQRAFETLLSRYGDKVYGYLLHYFGSPERAEDLTQEVFLRVVKSASSFRGESSFSTFLFRIMRNLCIDTLRTGKGRKAEQSLDDCDTMGNGERSKHEVVEDRKAGEAPRAVMMAEAMEALEAALLELPEEQREVFLLREIEGLRFKEIAEVLEVNENTVKSRMRYALKFLRERLRRYQEKS